MDVRSRYLCCLIIAIACGAGLCNFLGLPQKPASDASLRVKAYLSHPEVIRRADEGARLLDLVGRLPVSGQGAPSATPSYLARFEQIDAAPWFATPNAPDTRQAQPVRFASAVSDHGSAIRLASANLTIRQDDEDDEEEVTTTRKTWPKPTALLRELKSLSSVPLVASWVDETSGLLSALSELPADSPQVLYLIEDLEAQTAKIPALAARLWDPASVEAMSHSSDLARVGYAIARRLEIWKAVLDLPAASVRFTDADEVSPFRQASNSNISFDGLDPAWVEYLELEKLRRAIATRAEPDELRDISRDILARMYSPVLKPEQANYMQQVIDPAIVTLLKQTAAKPIDRVALLSSVELYESRPSSYTGDKLNDRYQDLLWSVNPEEYAAAVELDTHYRNANFRLAVSERLLNRLVPQLPTIAMPVSETIKGAQVSGQSQISNELRVEFLPDPTKLSLRLETAGRVQSDTVARTKSFRVLNQGDARFRVFKQLAIGRDGIDSSERPFSLTSANQNVVGIESKLDNVPLLGWMARKLAAKKLQEEAPETDRMFKEKVSSSAETKLQEEVETQVQKLRYYAYTNLYQPLIAMELEPEAIQMATTADQLVMRYRLAGRDQMAANTARPRDNGNSLLSFQVHQSAINNAIARIGLNGNTFTVDELRSHMQEIVGTTQITIGDQPPEEQPEFGFHEFDPIRVDLIDDRMKITLNLKSIRLKDDGKTWRNVSLTASYRMRADGMKLLLEQDDDQTLIRGRRMKLADKAAMSTLMKVVFKQTYELNALPGRMSERLGGDQLMVSQLVLANGWLGVSMDDRVQTATKQPAVEEGAEFRLGNGLRRLINRR